MPLKVYASVWRRELYARTHRRQKVPFTCLEEARQYAAQKGKSGIVVLFRKG